MKIIIDGNNVCHIASHSMGHLSNDERRTGVVFGFMKQLLFLSNRCKSNEFIFCWDSQKSLRKQIYPEYKGNRHNKEKTEQEEFERQSLYNQISELRREIVPELGFNNNFIKTGYEADDIIAYLTLTNPEQYFIIVSTDQDLYQILSEKVKIYNIITKKFFTDQDFFDKFQCHPTLFKEIKAIAGCTSDAVKGIQGVGESTAAKYIRNDSISLRLTEKINEGAELIKRNRILTYLPFSKDKSAMPNLGIKIQKDNLKLANFKKLFNQMSFNSFMNEISAWEKGFKL